MAYSKQTWDTTSYVNPTRMNHIEQGIYDATISYEDVAIETQSIPSGGAIDIYAPSDRKYIGCIFTSSSGVNAVLVSQLIYRPSSVNKWTTHLYNYYNSALTIGGYMRFFYIE